MTDLTGRIALVTGASRGIGYFTALELARLGAHVIAVARTLGGLEELDDDIKALGGTATLVPLDLSDMKAIDALGGQIHERWGKLDIRVISPISHIKAKEFDKVMTINLDATWRLARSVEPLLRASDAGRAVLLSSGVAHSCRPFWGAYAISKAAVETLGRVWAAELVNTSVRINSVNPGATRTAMRAQAVPGEDPSTLPDPRDVAKKIVKLADPGLSETGMLYDVRADRMLAYRDPV
jgi:NAD(P)-dependent dehydrogenase (short-subunit alcohol dehydrogenase family)